MTSDSAPSGVNSSPQQQSASGSKMNSEAVAPLLRQQQPHPEVDLQPLMEQINENSEMLSQLREDVLGLKEHINMEFHLVKQTLDEERMRYERLEDQINDLTELHQNEVANIKQVMTLSFETTF